MSFPSDFPSDLSGIVDAMQDHLKDLDDELLIMDEIEKEIDSGSLYGVKKIDYIIWLQEAKQMIEHQHQKENIAFTRDMLTTYGQKLPAQIFSLFEEYLDTVRIYEDKVNSLLRKINNVRPTYSEEEPESDSSNKSVSPRYIDIKIAYEDWKFEIPDVWVKSPHDFSDIYNGIVAAVGESNVKERETENNIYGKSQTYEVNIFGTPENFMDKLNQVFMSLMIAQNFITYVGHSYAVIKVMDKDPIIIEIPRTEAQHGFPMYDKIEALSDRLVETFQQIVSPSSNVERIESMIDDLRKSIISSPTGTEPETGTESETGTEPETEKTESLFAKLTRLL